MPKLRILKIDLPAEKPDCCALCKLVGQIPKSMRPKGSHESHVCLGTMEALGSRFIQVHASRKDSHHPLKRPCDERWKAWMEIPGRKFPMSYDNYLMCRVPYEQSQQLQIKFHK